MPLYEYRCNACGQHFEKIQRFSDPPVDVCPHCGERQVEKLLSSPAIQFKGSGWYVTDYARKGASGDSDKKTEGDKKAGDAAASKSAGADSKSASSSDSAASTTPSTTAAPTPAATPSKN